jgi:hypothetical protein
MIMGLVRCVREQLALASALLAVVVLPAVAAAQERPKVEIVPCRSP